MLAEYAEITPENSRDDPEVELYSLWLDREKGLLYDTRKDNCVQYLFRSPEKRDAILQVLIRQGCRKGEP